MRRTLSVSFEQPRFVLHVIGNLHLPGTTELGHELQVALVVVCTEEGWLAAVTRRVM